MGLLRYQVFLSHGICWLAVWIVFMKQQNETDIILSFAPLWAIVILGVYLLSLLVVGVRSFKDCPDAGRELVKDILEAEREMRRRGVIK
jgi:dolichol-phosphate mannosyltransferase subunit 3